MFEITILGMLLIALIMSTCLLISVFHQVPSEEQKLLQLLTFANWLTTLGNVITVSVSPENGASVGDTIMFMGGSLLTFSLFRTFAHICEIPLKKISIYIMLLINLLFVVLACLNPLHHLVYTNTSFIREGNITINRCSYGPVFYIYSIWQFLYIIHLICLVLKCKKNNPLRFRHLKKSLFRFLIFGTIGYIPYLVIIVSNFEVEITGICTTFIGIFLIITFNRNNVYPVRFNSKDIIIDEMNDLLIVTSVDGSYEYSNALAKTFVPELKNFPFGLEISGINNILDEMLARKDGEEWRHNDLIFVKKILPFEFKGKHLGDIHWFQDQTQQLRSMQEIINLKEEADRANEAKSTFLAHMSHEIRTPINGVLGLDEMLIREARDSQTFEIADRIMRTGKTLLSLINDVLDFSKIEAGKMELVEAPYSPSAMLSDLMLAIEHKADEKGLSVTLNQKNLPDGLMGDETRVKQIITNLLTNAVKYTIKGGVTIDISYTDSGELVASVTDTGIGIKKEDMDKLFGSFERIENIINHRTEGTGLGISIVISLLKLMGGHLDVQSEYGKGSTFTAVIPQTPAKLKDAVIHKETEDKNKPLFTAPEATVLIVDDNQTNLVVAKGLLKRNLVQAELCTSGPEFLEKIKEKHYDLILLDHRMPDMDGLEAFELMKNMDHLCKDVPIIMMTAEADVGARDFYLNAGMTEYISKPLNSTLYESMVARLLPPEKVHMT